MLSEKSKADDKLSYKCSIAMALDIIGGKWKPLILWYLKDEVLRFGELKKRMSGVSQKMLTQHLKQLEEDGLISRCVHSEIPPKVEYSITDRGQTVIPILDMIAKWGTENCIPENDG